MYISKLFVKNYRSLKEIKIDLYKGKNVLVGKNNAGKSNILKALNILVGKRHPSYLKFTDNDYYTITEKQKDKTIENVADDIYLEVEIEGRDFEEDVILSIKKNTAFSKLRSIKDAYQLDETTGEILVNYPLFQSLDDLVQRDEIDDITLISKAGNPYQGRTKWADASTLLSMIKDAKKIKLFFCKNRKDEDLKGYGILLMDANKHFWLSHFLPKKLRKSLITTTIIGALRSTKNELRLQSYTWFGKLIGKLWNDNKDSIEPESKETYETLIKGKSSEIKSLVDVIFKENTAELKKLLESAIAHKEVSFKFLSDNKFEMYKGIQIFVNDGIDRPVNEKGTGIQSAIIIALFSQYCNQFHNASSLLVVEEPELYLHPQARRVISAELNKFINSGKTQERQLFISPHSIEYLKNVDPKNIIRIYKDDKANCSLVAQLTDEVAKEVTAEIKRFIWSANTEMFFADKVVLVEGGEVYLLPTLIDRMNNVTQYLDYNNLSVARVNGKSNFLIYIKILNSFNIEWVLVGDLDCYKSDVGKICLYLNLGDIFILTEEIKDAIAKGETNYKGIKKRIDKIERNIDIQNLKSVFEKFRSGEIKSDDESLLKILDYMDERYIKKNIRTDIKEKLKIDRFNEIQNILRGHNIFIWSFGELEDYYTPQVIQMKGSKDMKALELSYLVSDQSNDLGDFFLHQDDIQKLMKLIKK